MRFTKQIGVQGDPADVFAYVADFSNAAEWDPGVVSARRLSTGPIAVGSRFELIALFRRQQHRFEYTVTSLDAGRRIVLDGVGERASSRDTVTVAAAQGGCLVTYDADIRLHGATRLAAPVLALVFRRLGDRALDSLRATLDARAAER